MKDYIVKKIVQSRYYMGRAGWWMGTPMQIFQVVGIAKLIELDKIFNISIWAMAFLLFFMMILIGRIDVALGVAKEEASYNQQFVQRPTGPIAQLQQDIKDIKERVNGLQ